MTGNPLFLLLGILAASCIIALFAVHNVKHGQRRNALAMQLIEAEACKDDLVACLQGMLEKEKSMLLHQKEMERELDSLREKLKEKENEMKQATAHWMEERSRLMTEMREKEAILRQQFELRIIEAVARIEKRVRAEFEAKVHRDLPSEEPKRS